MKYYLYHIFGKKIGVTCDLKDRLTRQQGYGYKEYEVLDSSDDIDYISNKEIELQKKYGYKVDRQSYKELVTKSKLNKMVLNVTEQTTTFPFPLNKLKGNLMDTLGVKMDNSFGKYVLTADLCEWIVKNAKTSMYNPARSFIYNKAMDEYCKSLGKQSMAIEHKNQPEVVTVEVPNVYDLIRQWADERGIYRNGDTKTQFVKLMEEGGELGRSILKNDRDEFIDAIGDMVVVLTNLAALEGLKIEDCVTSAYDVIKSRHGHMVNGTFVKEDKPCPITGSNTSTAGLAYTEVPCNNSVSTVYGHPKNTKITTTTL
jgi:NTP pyrophosphatase (non-canonical NTP hydrolase)